MSEVFMELLDLLVPDAPLTIQNGAVFGSEGSPDGRRQLGESKFCSFERADLSVDDSHLLLEPIDVTEESSESNACSGFHLLLLSRGTEYTIIA